jgi:undecaprenyl diphosphate synthase
MLWDLAYTELFFCHKLWPDFTEADLQEAVNSFSQRHRSFGRR